MGNHLQPGCNETEVTCLVRSFDDKATVNRMFAVLALPWMNVSESVFSTGLVSSRLGDRCRAQGFFVAKQRRWRYVHMLPRAYNLVHP